MEFKFLWAFCSFLMLGPHRVNWPNLSSVLLEKAELSASALSVALIFMWQCCCCPALAATRNSVFMCDSNQMSTVFFPAFLAKHSGDSGLGASKHLDPLCSKERTIVFSFCSGFSMFFVMCQVQDDPSGHT